MKPMDVQRIALTPLSPVHIGCGQDFEPVNYVIDEGFLLHFDPSLAPLEPRDLAALRAAVGAGREESLPRVQRFFHERRELFAGVARRAVAVVPGVVRQYEERIGQAAMVDSRGARRYNQLEIERTAHHPHTDQPYVPGSSLKGAIRTAWLASIHRHTSSEEKSDAMERRLLEGSFGTDPFRLLRLADADGLDVGSEVVFSTNHRRQAAFDRKTGGERDARGPSARREVIVAGQYRALSTEIRFDSLRGLHVSDKTPVPNRRIESFSVLARAVNAHYLPLLREELSLLEQRRLCATEWGASLRRLLAMLAPAFDAGQSMLLRVGRHSGAEAVTLPQVRRILIRRGPGKPAEISRIGATTVWLAARTERDRTGMLPFGWVLLEPATSNENPALRDWCDAQVRPDFDTVRRKLADMQTRARERAELAAAQRRAQAQQEAEAEMARAALEARLASLTEQGRLIDQLRGRLEAHTGRKQPVSGQLYQEVRKLLLQADAGGWSSEDRAAFAALLEMEVPARVDLGGKAKEIRAAAARLRGAA